MKRRVCSKAYKDEGSPGISLQLQQTRTSLKLNQQISYPSSQISVLSRRRRELLIQIRGQGGGGEAAAVNEMEIYARLARGVAAAFYQNKGGVDGQKMAPRAITGKEKGERKRPRREVGAIKRKGGGHEGEKGE
jgi:hypothetical protein